MLNGKPVETLKLSPENNDLLHQFVLKGIAAQQPNLVQLKFEGTGGLAYQVVGRYFTPWEEKPVDRTSLDRRDLRPDQAGAERHCHRKGYNPQQP